ncbi:hypothetical protein [Burkholderia diffusa]|uniref:hypothetical protein n=1 Tax=Burkholderia diffusa TaxID=488732 RepID=UPI0012D8A4A8|nr:hypothetical protein [Burkholderia diffusa]
MGASEQLPDPGRHIHKCELNKVIFVEPVATIQYKRIPDVDPQLLSLDIHGASAADSKNLCWYGFMVAGRRPEISKSQL